jgi:hypothetical protein
VFGCTAWTHCIPTTHVYIQPVIAALQAMPHGKSTMGKTPVHIKHHIHVNKLTKHHVVNAAERRLVKAYS